jgi:hypothetical protein
MRTRTDSEMHFAVELFLGVAHYAPRILARQEQLEGRSVAHGSKMSLFRFHEGSAAGTWSQSSKLSSGFNSG